MGRAVYTGSTRLGCPATTSTALKARTPLPSGTLINPTIKVGSPGAIAGDSCVEDSAVGIKGHRSAPRVITAVISYSVGDTATASLA